MHRFQFLIFILIALCYSCAPRQNEAPLLTSINIIDRNGLSETVSSADRLKQYENVDFLSSQPYQKVLRIYNRDQNGEIHAFITSYHPNGQPKQYLEVVNNRAHGTYREWHESGNLKLEAYVIGGEADINNVAEASWLFEGCSRVWDECGTLIADIPYCNGELQGPSVYYHPNGVVWKQIPYIHNQMHGIAEFYLDSGTLLQTVEYANGLKQGTSKRFWGNCTVAADEHYSQGLLIMGRYFDRNGNLLAQIDNGNGFRAVFGKESLSELQEYHNGVLEGKIKYFAVNGALVKSTSFKNDLKHGEEVEYYASPAGVEPEKKLSVNWSEGKIQGLVKTWYPNGTQESQREMANNCKNGILTAWYQDGSIMLIEEYDRNKLIKGEYFPIGDKIPVSEINNGHGLATLYDAQGIFLKRVLYNNGKPLID